MADKTFKEMKDTTKIVVIGILNEIQEFTSKKTGVVYRSMDLIVKGNKQPVNVQLPPDYPLDRLVEGELVQIPVVTQNFGGKLSLKVLS